MIKVKICGLTNLEDAQVAVDAGADYLGFIFYPPSKRSITPAEARPIVSHLRRLPHCPVLVGVFVNESGAHMAQILDECELDLAQLSGEEPPFLVGDERSPIYGRAYKAIRPASFLEAEADVEWYTPETPHPAAPTILIDTYHPTLRGGTGTTGDWELSAQLAEKTTRLMLAGGLTVANVATAVAQVQPFAVDVASGVESAPGRKDHDLVRAFIQNVNG